MKPIEHRHFRAHNRRLMVESLEIRLLLSSSNLKTGPLAKIGDELATDYLTYNTDAELQAIPLASQASGESINTIDPLLHLASGDIQIEAYANDSGQGLAESIQALGAVDVQYYGKAVTASVPIDELGQLAALGDLRFAEPTWYVTSTGAVTSQGDTADKAITARSTYGLTGAGVKVGILSDSFNTSGNTDTYATDIASGDLPGNVQILNDYSGTNPAPTDEGRAMAQVIYDSAPSASLLFDTAEGGQSLFAQHIHDLATAGAKVIVDDTTYLAEPMFEDGVIAQAAESVIANGVTYISAVGNNGRQAYESAWRTGTVRTDGSISSADGAPHFYGGTTFNFNSGSPVNDEQSFTLGAGKSILLSFQWDSPYFSATGSTGSPNDMDIYVLNSDGSQVVGGSATNNVGGDPTEVFQFTNSTGSSTNYKLMLTWNTAVGGPQPGYLKYVDFDGQATNWGFSTNSGAAFGHANAAGVESIAAASYKQTPAFGTTPAVVEPDSSAGPTPIFFDNAGNRLSPSIVRQTPGITAPDNVDNTFFGTDTDGDGHPNFTGTSAAAASAAGVAALLLQKDPVLTPAQLDSALQSTALDMGTAGVDFNTGFGLIQANAAIASVVGTVTGTVYHDNNGDGLLDNSEPGFAGVTVYVDSNNDGTLDTGEISTITASNGTFTLTNVNMGSELIREITPNGYVDVVGSKTITLSGAGSVSATNLGVFPTTYTGTSGNDVFLLQVDASNSSDIDVVMNNVTFTAAKSILPAIAFTPGAGNDQLTINFLNGNPIPTGGLVYDGGSSSGDSLILNGTNNADTISVNNLTTNVNSDAPIFATNIESETINGNGGNDIFTLTSAQPSTESLTFNGGAGNDTLTVKNAPVNNGSNTFFNGGTASSDQDTLTVNAGTFQLAGDPQTGSANLTVNDNASVVFPVGSGINARHLAALNIGAGATATVNTPSAHTDRAVMVLGGLSINATGKLDLGGNDMLVKGGVLATIISELKTGFAAHTGYWNGSAGIVSSAAATNTKFQTTLGVIQNTNGSMPLYPMFDGQNSTTADVLVKYTYYGDADLNGVVNGADYAKVDAGFHSHTGTWLNGDFDYDGVIDGSDYTLIDNMFNFQGSPL
jgi:hypothetical protein